MQSSVLPCAACAEATSLTARLRCFGSRLQLSSARPLLSARAECTASKFLDSPEGGPQRGRKTASSSCAPWRRHRRTRPTFMRRLPENSPLFSTRLSPTTQIHVLARFLLRTRSQRKPQSMTFRMSLAMHHQTSELRSASLYRKLWETLRMGPLWHSCPPFTHSRRPFLFCAKMIPCPPFRAPARPVAGTTKRCQRFVEGS